jgi:hypothetical protein
MHAPIRAGRFLGISVFLLCVFPIPARSQDVEAFWKHLAVPGEERYAVTLARPKAKEFLKLLRDQAEAKKIPLPRRKLIEGDLHLALGEKDEALQC